MFKRNDQKPATTTPNQSQTSSTSERPLKCTCNNAGTCGYCPSIAVTAMKQGRLKEGSVNQSRGDSAAFKVAARNGVKW
jgi:hypothetical protein